ncbi:MAG: hypothetical protein QMD71_09105 [bacterium]|nr:hypothetical protein [bacterium]
MHTIKRPYIKILSTSKELLNSLRPPVIGGIDETITVTYSWSDKFPKLSGCFLSSKVMRVSTRLLNLITYKDGNIYLQNWDDVMFIIYDADKLTETVYIKRNTHPKQFLCTIRNVAIVHGTLFLLGCRDYICIHSTAVSNDGRGLLLVGPSRSGKTTFCISLLEKGFSFLSDDKVLLKQDKVGWNIFPFFLDLPKVNHKRAQFYPNLSPIVDNGDTNSSRSFTYSDKSILHKIFLPHFSNCQGLKVKSIGKKNVLCRILGDKFNFAPVIAFCADDRKRIDFIFDLVKNTDCYTVELGKGWIKDVTKELFMEGL